MKTSEIYNLLATYINHVNNNISVCGDNYFLKLFPSFHILLRPLTMKYVYQNHQVSIFICDFKNLFILFHACILPFKYIAYIVSLL